MPKRDRAAEYGAPPDKKRMLFYAICEPCRHSDGAQERIEKAIRSGLRDFRIVKGAQ